MGPGRGDPKSRRPPPTPPPHPKGFSLFSIPVLWKPVLSELILQDLGGLHFSSVRVLGQGSLSRNRKRGRTRKEARSGPSPGSPQMPPPCAHGPRAGVRLGPFRSRPGTPGAAAFPEPQRESLVSARRPGPRTAARSGPARPGEDEPHLRGQRAPEQGGAERTAARRLGAGRPPGVTRAPLPAPPPGLPPPGFELGLLDRVGSPFRGPVGGKARGTHAPPAPPWARRRGAPPGTDRSV